MNRFKYFISEKGFLFFQIGIFLTLSAPNIAAIFILFSLLCTHSKNNDHKLIKSKWILPFFFSGVIAIISAFFSSFRYLQIDGWDKSLAWIGLGNWLPFFYVIWRSQIYLKNVEMRRKVSNMLLAGTVPFIFSGFGQLWFDWHGPLIFMNGLIIWFQRSINTDNGQGITAMFNNQNYAACWLIIIWPFCLNKFLITKGLNFKKLLLIVFTILIIFSVYLTKSRNGLSGTITSSLFMIDKSYIAIILLIVSAYFLATLSFIPEYIQNIFRKLFPENLIKAFEFSKITNILNEPRIYIYQNTIPIIMERPFFGWGAASFPILFNERYLDFTREPTHPHNLILEMANSYGLIFASIISLSIIIIIFLSFKIIFLSKKQIINSKSIRDFEYDKAWWSSFFALFLSQMYDVQYFDFRISISFWILLTGLICIIESKFYDNLINE